MKEPLPRHDDPQSARLLTEIRNWQPVLRILGVSGEQLAQTALRARENGSTFKSEMIASGVVTEAGLYRALAEYIDVSYIDDIGFGEILTRDVECLAELGRQNIRVLARLGADSDPSNLIIAPTEVNFESLNDLRGRSGGFKSRIVMSTPTALRAALMNHSRNVLTRTATVGLFDSSPEFSARVVATARQGVLVGLVMLALPLLLYFFTTHTFVSIHLASALLFTAYAVLRISAAHFVIARPRARISLPLSETGDRPVYSVLVALYREQEVVPQLLISLSRLVWPRNKLEIKLICEADDHRTIEAIRSHELRSCVEVIEVPPSHPRTKPKALNYALPLTSGAFVALFDAEDRPHPYQLVEAWSRFQMCGENIACLQAPLKIDNPHACLLARLFAFEYTALFQGLLPWLAEMRSFLPLGGTSTHFRRTALVNSGNWDPYNVTEDADLGLRLARHGYAIETLHLPTLESAPDTLSSWMPQRTRWCKGWMQTWLVHMRRPHSMLAELGIGGFVRTQILLAGIVLSMLTYPVLLASVLIYSVASLFGWRLDTWQYYLLGLDLINLAIAYSALLILGYVATPKAGRRNLVVVALSLPGYWLLISIAAWRAIWELIRAPHHWNKTPHKISAPRAAFVRPMTSTARVPH